MSQIEVNIDALTGQLNAAKDAQRKLERLQRLCKNKDFRELILEEYCVQECARLTHMSIHPSQSSEERAKFLVMAQATGGVKLFIHAQEQMLASQINSIPKIEQELESARHEEQFEDDEA
ncbi:hypothetical protein [Xanthomonas virus PB119]|nr:hypothetical protein [Xanthomonas virus PB119]